jgi:hypothetical protein
VFRFNVAQSIEKKLFGLFGEYKCAQAHENKRERKDLQFCEVQRCRGSIVKELKSLSSRLASGGLRPFRLVQQTSNVPRIGMISEKN